VRTRPHGLPRAEITRTQRWSEGRTVIDIGAHVGTRALCWAGAGADRVYAIEPNPDNFECLVTNLRSHGLAGAILPDCCAIADYSGPGRLRRSESNSANHALRSPRTPGSLAKTLPVQVWRLDEWMAEFGVDRQRVGLVKVDTQGWESQVLTGAPALSAQPGTAWILEVSPKHLVNAGTSLESLTAQLEALFARVSDLRDKTMAVLPITEVRPLLARILASRSYADLVLQH
jgi:FkbM family methyltransferase